MKFLDNLKRSLQTPSKVSTEPTAQTQISTYPHREDLVEICINFTNYDQWINAGPVDVRINSMDVVGTLWVRPATGEGL